MRRSGGGERVGGAAGRKGRGRRLRDERRFRLQPISRVAEPGPEADRRRRPRPGLRRWRRPPVDHHAEWPGGVARARAAAGRQARARWHRHRRRRQERAVDRADRLDRRLRPGLRRKWPVPEPARRRRGLGGPRAGPPAGRQRRGRWVRRVEGGGGAAARTGAAAPTADADSAHTQHARADHRHPLEPRHHAGGRSPPRRAGRASRRRSAPPSATRTPRRSRRCSRSSNASGACATRTAA